MFEAVLWNCFLIQEIAILPIFPNFSYLITF